MPKPFSPTAIFDEREEFFNGFQRSRKGNLWRTFAGVTVSIFRRPSDGFYAWSIANSETVRFSRSTFDSEQEALDALAYEMDVG